MTPPLIDRRGRVYMYIPHTQPPPHIHFAALSPPHIPPFAAFTTPNDHPLVKFCVDHPTPD